MNAHLLKYLTILSIKSRMHSAQSLTTPLTFRLCLARRRISLRTFKMATIRLPKQIDPNEYVSDLERESLMAFEQNEEASMGANQKVPITPALVAVVSSSYGIMNHLQSPVKGKTQNKQY